MVTRIHLQRFLALAALSIWIGGFTFYSSVVIPVLHARLGSPRQVGLITQQVTVALNVIGVVTLVLGWVRHRGDISDCPHPRWWSWPLSTSTICLVGLFLIHGVLDEKVEAGRFSGFYPWHRAYLWTSTVQWFANLGLLAQWSGLVPRPQERAL